MKLLSFLGSVALLAGVCSPVASAQDYPRMSNLPTLYIETENHQSITSKETYINATLRYVDADGQTYYDALGIRGRGNSTWGLAKKPYRIKFNKKQEFLGPDRAKAKSWTLIANYADKSLMRNALAACLGTFAGQPFTAAARFVDVNLNGQYIGNYQISDQIEVRAKRVDIVEQEDPMTDHSNITGGYLLEVDGFAYAEPVKFYTKKGIGITVKSPDDEIIDQRQVDYISSYIQEFEDALFSADFTDPQTGYRKYVDENTLLSWYTASEMTGNPDAFWSTYIYKNQDDSKIYWGPLWDYDIAFNNCLRKGDMAERLVLNDGYGADLTGIWIRRMWEDPWFVAAVNDKWQSMVEAGLEQHLLDFIDTTEAELIQSQKLDNKLWPVNVRVYDEYQIFNSYRATVEYLRVFISQRVAYLSEKFAEEAGGKVPTPPLVIEYDYYYRIHNISTMKCADLTADGTQICGKSYVDGTHSQQWSLEPADGDFFAIVNRENGLAITDRAPYSNGSYELQHQLGVAELNIADPRQQWRAVPIPTGGTYALANRATDLAWNNAGGSADEGNPFISWVNNSENPNKPNRQWRIIRDELKEAAGMPELAADACDYVVTYSPSASLLKFYTKGTFPQQSSYTIATTSGTIVMSGSVAETIDVSTLDPGVHILSWQINGRHITRKFLKI